MGGVAELEFQGFLVPGSVNVTVNITADRSGSFGLDAKLNSYQLYGLKVRYGHPLRQITIELYSEHGDTYTLNGTISSPKGWINVFNADIVVGKTYFSSQWLSEYL